jgi:NADH:ubiquinone oxidoreductase subunit H
MTNKKFVNYSKNIYYFLGFMFLLSKKFNGFKASMFIKKKKFSFVSLVSTPKTSKRKDHQFEYKEYSGLLKLYFPIKVQDNYFLINKLFLNLLLKFSSILLFSNKVKFFYKIYFFVITLILNIIILIYYYNYFFIGFIHIFVLFLFMFLQIVFFTSCERKILALTQRRIGPRVVGARGRLQFIADAVKLLTKVNASPKKINLVFFQGSAVAAYWLSWLSFSNMYFSYGENILEIEHNVFFGLFCAIAFSIAWIVAGWSAVSKYSLLGCMRACVQSITYEILMSAVFLNVFLYTGTVNFEMLVMNQEMMSFVLFFPYLAIIGFFATLIETNRPPFDLSEAESDLVSGYVVEYAGILFGLFYLAEYLNLFINSVILCIIFLGSWWSLSNYFYYFYSSVAYVFNISFIL